MAKFEYYSDGEFNRVSKYVPINGINTTFMYAYDGPHDLIKDRECEKIVDQEVARILRERQENGQT